MKTVKMMNRGKKMGVKVPEVGDGGTHSPLTDCYPCTVIAVSPSGKTVTVQDDSHKVVGGKWPDLEYEYARNPEGTIRVAKLRKDGRYHIGVCGVWFGSRRFYQDPSF